MGATSVTGKGKGAANHKGPKNNRDVYVPLLSPHVVSAGHVTVSGGATTVTFPSPLTGSNTGYAVVVTAQAATTTVVKVTTKTNNSDGNFASFVVTGDNIAYSYIVVKTGNQ
jgi:hypothetical protein